MIDYELFSNMTIQEDVLKLRIENEQLKQQIEKMKCCTNCAHFKEYDDYPDLYYACELKECDNLDRWELVE